MPCLSQPHSYSEALCDGTSRGPREASAWPSNKALITSCWNNQFWHTEILRAATVIIKNVDKQRRGLLEFSASDTQAVNTSTRKENI